VARSRSHAHARTRRAFSQNFLADPVAVRRIADAAELKPDDLVIEVGAGVVDWCLRAPTLTSATLLTQLEYAWKRTGHYGRWTRLTISTWPVIAWQFKGRIPRGSFRPVPRVDSGILRLERRDVPLVQPAALGAYRRFVDLGFGGIGGSLCLSLARRYGTRRATGACRAARVGADTPVGLAWPEQWLTLFRILDHPGPHR